MCPVANLGCLALAEELLAAHDAMPARQLERGDHPVARFDRGDLGTDLFHDPHRLVTHDVALAHKPGQGLVQVQVRTAEVRASDFYDGISGLSMTGSGTVPTLAVRFACQVTAFIRQPPPGRRNGPGPPVVPAGASPNLPGPGRCRRSGLIGGGSPRARAHRGFRRGRAGRQGTSRRCGRRHGLLLGGPGSVGTAGPVGSVAS